jgi:hypothetical protein
MACKLLAAIQQQRTGNMTERQWTVSEVSVRQPEKAIKDSHQWAVIYDNRFGAGCCVLSTHRTKLGAKMAASKAIRHNLRAWKEPARLENIDVWIRPTCQAVPLLQYIDR